MIPSDSVVLTVKEVELQTTRDRPLRRTTGSSVGYAHSLRVINSERHRREARRANTCSSLTTMPVEGLRSSSMMKRYLRAKKVARVDGISMQGYVAGEKSGCHPLGKMLSKSSSFSELSCKWSDSSQFYVIQGHNRPSNKCLFFITSMVSINYLML